MKVRLKKLEAYNALNSTELKVILRDINLEIVELKQDATNLARDTGLATNSISPPTVAETREYNKKIILTNHRSSTLNNHAEYILIIIASKRK